MNAPEVYIFEQVPMEVVMALPPVARRLCCVCRRWQIELDRSDGLWLALLAESAAASPGAAAAGAGGTSPATGKVKSTGLTKICKLTQNFE